MEPVLTWLYVPGNRPDRFDKAAASGADVVVLDLEDAVLPAAKEQARAEVLAWLPSAAPDSVEVRVNAIGTPWFPDDLAALGALPALRAVRVPKIASAPDVHRVTALLAEPVPIGVLIESAAGVLAAPAIAAASPRVRAIGLGEADLRSELGVADDGLAAARATVVLAARAAGLAPPAASVYPDIADLSGLAASTRSLRRLGFLGRAAVHPSQLPVIRESFRPAEAEVEAAHRVLDGLTSAASAGSAVILLADGRMADPAMVGAARRTLALAGRFAD